MDTVPLYNLSPMLRLMGMGLVVAVGPLAWVWLRSRDASPARRVADAWPNPLMKIPARRH